MQPLRYFGAFVVVQAITLWLFSLHTEPRDVFYLDFTGAKAVDIPRFPPFGGHAMFSVSSLEESLPLHLRQDSDAIERLIVDEVRSNFSRWGGVDVRKGEHHEHPDGNVVVVGGGSVSSGFGVLGIAQSVDLGNRKKNERAIVFAANVSYSLALDSSPGVVGTARALASVASHEIGHLLGFAHVPSGGDIMSSPIPPAALRAGRKFVLHHQNYVNRTVLWLSE